jgi:putative membrane protein
LVQGIADQLAANVGTTPPAANCDPTKTLTCGAAAVNAGASQVATGNKDLASGLTTLAGGAGQVADGSDQLASGLATLSGGATQVADGADQLATGLAPAATGSTQISDGLGQALIGGRQIEDGANQLSAQGTKKLIATGNDTTNSYGEQYALMQALNVRSATQQGIPDGPATGSDVATTGAFAYTLDGVSQADATNGVRFLLAAVLLAAAVGVGIAFARD